MLSPKHVAQLVNLWVENSLTRLSLLCIPLQRFIILFVKVIVKSACDLVFAKTMYCVETTTVLE